MLLELCSGQQPQQQQILQQQMRLAHRQPQEQQQHRPMQQAEQGGIANLGDAVAASGDVDMDQGYAQETAGGMTATAKAAPETTKGGTAAGGDQQPHSANSKPGSRR